MLTLKHKSGLIIWGEDNKLNLQKVGACPLLYQVKPKTVTSSQFHKESSSISDLHKGRTTTFAGIYPSWLEIAMNCGIFFKARCLITTSSSKLRPLRFRDPNYMKDHEDNQRQTPNAYALH